jgi:hypothetical protein
VREPYKLAAAAAYVLYPGAVWFLDFRGAMAVIVALVATFAVGAIIRERWAMSLAVVQPAWLGAQFVTRTTTASSVVVAVSLMFGVAIAAGVIALGIMVGRIIDRRYEASSAPQ